MERPAGVGGALASIPRVGLTFLVVVEVMADEGGLLDHVRAGRAAEAAQ